MDESDLFTRDEMQQAAYRVAKDAIAHEREFIEDEGKTGNYVYNGCKLEAEELAMFDEELEQLQRELKHTMEMRTSVQKIFHPTSKD